MQLVGDFVLQSARARPVFQEGVKIRQFEEVVLRFFFHRRSAGNGGVGVFQIRRGVGGTAGFAVVAVLVASVTFRAFALDVTVSEENLFHRVEQLSNRAHGDVALVTTGLVDLFGEVTVFFAVGAVKVVEANLETGKVGFMLGFYCGNLFFRGAAFLFGAQHDRGTVGIVSTHVGALVATGFLESNPNVGLDVFQQMTEVNRAVGVRQGAGDQDFARAVCHGMATGGKRVDRKAAIVAAMSGRFTCQSLSMC